MSEHFVSFYGNPEPYIPCSLSEIYDMLASFVGAAPTMIDKSGYFPERNLDSEFATLVAGFGKVRSKLGEERYAQLIALAARTKQLYADDPDYTNGKTEEGIKLVYEMEDIIQSVRRKRVKAKEKDEDGEVSGD